MPPKTATPDLPQDAHIPVGTPPGGGRWTWSAEARDWVPVQPAQDTTPTDSPQE